MDLNLPIQYPTTIYVPVYSLDGIKCIALRATNDVHEAKSRLRSALPAAWELSDDELKGKYENLKCGLLVFDIGKQPSSIVEFPIIDFLKG